MREYRVVIIGCGARGHDYAESYAAMPNAKVVACCDIVPEKSRKLALDFKLHPYTNPREMLQKEKPDLVHLTTYPDTRVELMSLVAEMGIRACTVEKPICVGVDDWRKLCALEATSGTRFAVSHQCRWQPNFVRCLDALKSGKLGVVKFLDMSAGMNISGQGTHILHYATAFNGDLPVTHVFGAAAGLSEMQSGHPGPDTTAGYLTFSNGVRALWNNGPTAPRCGDPAAFWKHVRVSAYAERGRVSWEEFARWEIAGPGGMESGDYGSVETWHQHNLKAQAAFHQAMFVWIEDGAHAPGTNLKQSLHEWKVVLALYASALWRKPLVLSEFNPPDNLLELLTDALRVGG